MTIQKKILLTLALLLTSLSLPAARPTVRANLPRQAGQPLAGEGLFLPIILQTPGCIQTFPVISPDNLNFELQVVALINQERARYDKPVLAIAPELTQAARLQSRFMADNSYWNHVWPDGTTPWDRMHWACYNFSAAGEDIAGGQPSPAEVVSAWMESQGHRDIILDVTFQEVGVGYAYNANSTYQHYWTADFGSR